jgi:hypothetical protein
LVLKKKKLKNTLCNRLFLYSNHRVVLPWCSQSLAFIELLVDNVNSQAFNILLAVRYLAETRCGKNAEAAENGYICNSDLFQCFVTCCAVALAAHQAIESQGQSVLCAISAF